MVPATVVKTGPASVPSASPDVKGLFLPGYQVNAVPDNDIDSI
jgi:hypothetical protein